MGRRNSSKVAESHMIMSEQKSLDFMVIGAQKCGTTSLFRYIAEHPELYLPFQKELPFFIFDDLYEAGLSVFLRDFFSAARTDQLWGTVTPQYMCDPRAPERIANQLPHVKLIAILRDPVERAISHWKMTVRRGLETRSMEEAFTECLKPDIAERARQLHQTRSVKEEVHCYLVWGEYGRILKSYVALFGMSQLLLLRQCDLANEPATVVRRLFEFLGVNADFVPVNLDTRYHVGSIRKRTEVFKYLNYFPFAKRIWCRLPKRCSSLIRMKFEFMNASGDKGTCRPLDPKVEVAVRRYFDDDQLFLKQLMGYSRSAECNYTGG